MGSVAWLVVLLLSKGNKIFVTPEKALNFDSFSKIQAMLEVVAQPKWFNFMRRWLLYIEISITEVLCEASFERGNMIFIIVADESKRISLLMLINIYFCNL